MKDKNKTKEQLMEELAKMRLRIVELEKVESECKAILPHQSGRRWLINSGKTIFSQLMDFVPKHFL